MSISNHTFALCAYKKSDYLEECIKSLINQTKKSEIIIATSTPNEFIYGLAEKYSIPVFVNGGVAGIAGDWNFGYSKATTEYVTIAHQDDVYEPDYAEKIIKKMEKCKKPIIGFTEYFEIRNGERVYKNKLLKIKRFLNFPFRIFKKSRFIRRRVLSVGSPICCPAVTYNVKNCNNLKFDTSFQNCCDWDAWERLSKEKGSCVYLKQPLMGHRIHKESTTTKMIENSRRSEEEFIMFRRFWPRFIAKKLSKTFQKSYVSNDV